MQAHELPRILSSQVSEVEWKGNYIFYDLALSKLGGDNERFIICNPEFDEDILFFIDEYPDTDKCIVWNYQGTWAVKLFKKGWYSKKGYLTLDLNVPKLSWKVNPGLANNFIKFKNDPRETYKISKWDTSYELVWYLDKRVNPTDDNVWAIKATTANSTQGIKDMGAVLPDINYTFNPALPPFNIDVDDCYPPYWLVGDTNAYRLDSKGLLDEKLWALKFEPTFKKTNKWNWLGAIETILPEKLDVIFISYHEPNAEANWQRVLEKAPWAKRVDGVEGIFNAHRAAAELSNTDMFYVVDGDAYLVDSWNFDYQPILFDRGCSYVWASQNPVNDLIYQNGGVKLFNKQALLEKDKWETLDMFSGVMKKIKSEDTVSCITAFNVDEFSSWRSAFREAVKLFQVNQMLKLDVWMTKGEDRPFGKYVVMGAVDGYKYAVNCRGDQTKLRKINDYRWLKKLFDEIRNR